MREASDLLMCLNFIILAFSIAVTFDRHSVQLITGLSKPSFCDNERKGTSEERGARTSIHTHTKHIERVIRPDFFVNIPRDLYMYCAGEREREHLPWTKSNELCWPELCYLRYLPAVTWSTGHLSKTFLLALFPHEYTLNFCRTSVWSCPPTHLMCFTFF